MSHNLFLYRFLEKADTDPQIGPGHISLYAAILYFYEVQQCANPISIFSRDLKKTAKIMGSGTYHKYMNELKSCGYISYLPSYNPMLGSLVYLNDIK